MIFHRNEIWVGLLLGLLLPFIGYAILLMFFEQIEKLDIGSASGFSFGFRQRTVAIIAICLNIFPINVYQKKRMTQTIRGMIIATFILVAIWLIYYGQQLFS
ncbi:MAG: hypothetical protein R2828_33850 [Saprospiraceae bacterium]